MDDSKYLFMSFRGTDEPAEDDDLSSPPNALAAALEGENVTYELLIYRLEAAQAAADEECRDLYPEGPASGPSEVFLYHFVTVKDHLAKATDVSARLFPEG